MAPVNSTMTDSSSNNDQQQTISNELTIIFGVLATLIALASVIVAVYQYRQFSRASTMTIAPDIEMQAPVAAAEHNPAINMNMSTNSPHNASSPTNTPDTAESAASTPSPSRTSTMGSDTTLVPSHINSPISAMASLSKAIEGSSKAVTE